MNWIDIASIVFVCVTMNHLGLIKAIQLVLKWNQLPIISCPKCCTMWLVLAYGLFKLTDFGGFISVLATSFLASYSAIWLELLEGYIDTLYMKLYGKIYETSDDTPAADPDSGYSDGTVPKLHQS